MAEGHILVVDDEPGLLDVLEWELTSLGYEVLTASNGATALQLIKLTDFDAVISDVRMPGLSGIDVLKAAKELSPDTEVIITTGYAEMETVVECVRGGAFDFVQKPFNLPSVMATVGRAIERRRLRASARQFESSLAISSNRDAKKLPDLIADGVLKVAECDDVSLWLPSKDGLYMAHRATRPGFEGHALMLPAEAVVRVAALGKPQVLPQDAGDDELLRLAHGSSVVYPLKVSDRLLGALTFSRYGDARPLRRADIERASALAAQVTLALENVRLQAQAVSSERLATIGQLAAGVAHEINNPVSYVMMSLEALEELLPQALQQASPALITDVKTALNDATEGANRIKEIVGDLKNMSRSDGATRRRVDVNEVVRAALRISGAELRHRIQVERQLAERCEVEGDAGKLTQVLVNLLVNAAHAMAHRPLAQNKVVVSTALEGGKLKVTVRDNGPGIAQENQQKVFDAFFTTKAPGVGTGLGLSISRDIVRSHGGELELSSPQGGGACFTLVLPPAPPAQVSAKPQPAPSQAAAQA